jgi:hypothetical protein
LGLPPRRAYPFLSLVILLSSKGWWGRALLCPTWVGKSNKVVEVLFYATFPTRLGPGWVAGVLRLSTFAVLDSCHSMRQQGLTYSIIFRTKAAVESHPPEIRGQTGEELPFSNFYLLSSSGRNLEEEEGALSPKTHYWRRNLYGI